MLNRKVKDLCILLPAVNKQDSIMFLRSTKAKYQKIIFLFVIIGNYDATRARSVGVIVGL